MRLNKQDVKIWDALVGMYKTEDGWLRPHTNWAHHRLVSADSIAKA